MSGSYSWNLFICCSRADLYVDSNIVGLGRLHVLQLEFLICCFSAGFFYSSLLFWVRVRFIVWLGLGCLHDVGFFDLFLY